MLAILKTQKTLFLPLFLMKPTITSNSHLKPYVVTELSKFFCSQLLLRSVMAVIICKIFYIEVLLLSQFLQHGEALS
jgi:hypothetical protein